VPVVRDGRGVARRVGLVGELRVGRGGVVAVGVVGPCDGAAAARARRGARDLAGRPGPAARRGRAVRGGGGEVRAREGLLGLGHRGAGLSYRGAGLRLGLGLRLGGGHGGGGLALLGRGEDGVRSLGGGRRPALRLGTVRPRRVLVPLLQRELAEHRALAWHVRATRACARLGRRGGGCAVVVSSGADVHCLGDQRRFRERGGEGTELMGASKY
jgi:hypothetical protein